MKEFIEIFRLLTVLLGKLGYASAIIISVVLITDMIKSIYKEQ